VFAPSVAIGAPDDPQPTQAQIEKQISAAEAELEIVIERYDAAQDTLRTTRVREATVASQLAPMEAAAEQAQSRLAQLAAHAYETPQMSGLAMLVDSTSTQQIIERLTLLDGLAAGRGAEIEALTAATSAFRLQQQTLYTLDHQQTALTASLANAKRSILSQIDKLDAMRATAPSVDTAGPSIGYVPKFSADAAGRAVKFAYDQIGKPYLFGAAGPNSYDCSGLTMAAWKQGGITLPHNAAEQYSTVAHIPRSALQPGDLVFYYSPIHHVAIYIGNGYVIHAPHTGTDVQIGSIGLAPIAGYGRP
jgi:cell wall-associated NlpC family hydrolase